MLIQHLFVSKSDKNPSFHMMLQSHFNQQLASKYFFEGNHIFSFQNSLQSTTLVHYHICFSCGCSKKMTKGSSIQAILIPFTLDSIVLTPTLLFPQDSLTRWEYVDRFKVHKNSQPRLLIVLPISSPSFSRNPKLMFLLVVIALKDNGIAIEKYI